MKILAYGAGVLGSLYAARLRESGQDVSILASRRIQLAKLLAAGYRFRFLELEGTLRHEMKIMNAGLASQPA